MSTVLISQLSELRPISSRKLNPTVFALIQNHSAPRSLVESFLVANGKFAIKPVNGIQSLANRKNLQATRKVHTLSAGKEHIINKLNIELSGGKSYPILTAVLGVIGGAFSGGAGLLFTTATTGLSLANLVQDVLARPGDEIWHVEEIGKSENKATYVSAFFLVDPYRKQTPNKGWLIHEEREIIQLS